MTSASTKTATSKPSPAAQTPASSRDARKTAMVILEVLGGGRTPTEAAQALGVSVVRFYTLEARALEGLVQACEPRARGPGKSSDRKLAALQRRVEQLERECSRKQTLLRLSQRTIGVAPTQTTPKKAGKRRTKKPMVRALRAATHLASLPSAGDDPPRTHTAE